MEVQRQSNKAILGELWPSTRSSVGRVLAALAVALWLCCVALEAAEAPRPKLQFINGTTQTVDIFWLKSNAERVPNGSVAPGKNTIITTTLGHRFVVIGREDKAESIVTSEVPVQTFRVGGVPAFYTQRVEAHGFPIVASRR